MKVCSLGDLNILRTDHTVLHIIIKGKEGIRGGRRQQRWPLPGAVGRSSKRRWHVSWILKTEEQFAELRRVRKGVAVEEYCWSRGQWLGEDEPFVWSWGEWWVWQAGKVNVGLGLEWNSGSLAGIFRGKFSSSLKHPQRRLTRRESLPNWVLITGKGPKWQLKMLGPNLSIGQRGSNWVLLYLDVSV